MSSGVTVPVCQTLALNVFVFKCVRMIRTDEVCKMARYHSTSLSGVPEFVCSHRCDFQFCWRFRRGLTNKGNLCEKIVLSACRLQLQHALLLSQLCTIARVVIACTLDCGVDDLNLALVCKDVHTSCTVDGVFTVDWTNSGSSRPLCDPRAVVANCLRCCQKTRTSEESCTRCAKKNVTHLLLFVIGFNICEHGRGGCCLPRGSRHEDSRKYLRTI